MEKNKLLIVDDDMPNLMELTHILQPEYRIFTVKDGTIAVERAVKTLPDLILLDIIMPGMSGFDVLAELKKNEKTCKIPVIFITGISESNNESEGLSVGAVDYIRKPFDAMVVKLRVRHQIQIVNLKRDMEYAASTAEMASKAKSVFLANMSHEIRTPMNAILGVTEILLQNENIPAEIDEGLSRIYSSCDLLMGIINDILDFSKIEAGKLDIMPNEYMVASLINDSVHLNMMRIDSKPIEFELQIDENIPAKLVGDELRIKQIFNNLLSNAFKYTDSGMVTLSVQTKPYTPLPPHDNENDWVQLVISVCDTGLGMTKEQLSKMFDEYSRFHHEKGKTIEGTGLGLSITQNLISVMNGKITVESQPGKGSLFTVYLPQKTVNSKLLGKETADNLKQFRRNYMKRFKRGQLVRDPMPYGTVLIVDDVETNLHVAVSLMKLYRLNIDSVMSGYKAIDLINEGKVYDIIFMDHMMPGMDGIETAKIIHESGYTAPIVALTANAVAGQADMFLQNGFDGFISKPIDIRQLNVLLNKFIRDKQPPEIIEAARIKYADNVQEHPHDSDSESVGTSLLDSFITDAKKAVLLFEEKCPQGFLSDTGDSEMLKKFIITVHGIKSALFNIHEKDISELALQLETAARDNNYDFVRAATPFFLYRLKELITMLEIEKHENSGYINSEEEHLDALNSKLNIIKQYASDYNRKGVLDTIAEIKNFSKETKDVLDTIAEHVMHSEFEEAEQIASGFISRIELKL